MLTTFRAYNHFNPDKSIKETITELVIPVPGLNIMLRKNITTNQETLYVDRQQANSNHSQESQTTPA